MEQRRIWQWLAMAAVGVWGLHGDGRTASAECKTVCGPDEIVGPGGCCVPRPPQE